MKVLLFHAAVSQLATVFVSQAIAALREDGHSAGERFLPSFKMEDEPADKLIVALTPTQAFRFKNRGVELVNVFCPNGQDDEAKLILVELPEDDAELKDFEFDDLFKQVDGPSTPTMALEQAKAEAIKRGLEVTPETTRLQLEHMLGVDIPAALQADDRRTDQVNNQGLAEQRIGVRTSTVLPSVNGLDLERMNDEQLRATAAKMGMKTSPSMKRETIINKMTSMFAKSIDAPEDSAPPAGGSGQGAPAPVPLEGMDVDALKAQAGLEGVDIGRMTSAESITKAIEAKRQEDPAHV